MISNVLSPAVYEALLPRQKVRTVDWSAANIPAPPPVAGNIRFDLFPYMVEPVDCLDSPDYDMVTLQMASRLGKTTGVQCWVMNTIEHNPHNGVWAEPDEPSLRRVMKRTWEMIDGTPGLAEKSTTMRNRSNRELLFQDCLIHGAYSGSVSTAADFAAFLVVLNELDKYSHRRRLDSEGEDAGEADFPKLVMERAKGCPGATIVLMSTPSVKGRSRIESYRLAGDQRRFYVPCPHCNHFQTLRTGRTAEEPGGIKYLKGPDGHSNPDVAFDTAWYECEACQKKILDQHRYSMMNDGLWIREGQRVSKDGRVTGKPLRSGRHASFGPLGTHYSLLPTITWGRIAREYVEAKQDPLGKAMRNYVNGWEGETWDPSPPQVTQSELAERLKSDVPRGEVPEDMSFITLSVDTGVSGTELLFYWMVTAWFKNATGHVVDWGFAVGADELWSKTDFYRPDITGIDSGGGRDAENVAVTERIYALVADRRNCWPIKGSSSNVGTVGSDWWSEGFQKAGATPKEISRKRKSGMGDLLIVNTHLSQCWRESLISGHIKPGEAGHVTLPVEVSEEPDLYSDLLEELTNDVLIDNKWKKRGGRANEAADELRYARVLAEKYTRGGKTWTKLLTRTEAAHRPVKKKTEPKSPGWVPQREGGWLNRG